MGDINGDGRFFVFGVYVSSGDGAGQIDDNEGGGGNSLTGNGRGNGVYNYGGSPDGNGYSASALGVRGCGAWD